jgi:hypothetical protein
MNPMTIEKQVELVNDSFERCIGYSTFFDRFYERFGESSDEISGKFHEVDFEKQNRALRDAFYSLFRAIAGEPDAWQQLEQAVSAHLLGVLGAIWIVALGIQAIRGE